MVSPYIAAAARRATKFEIGSVWRPRAGHRDGWYDVKIVAITDHGTCPIIGQQSDGYVRCYGLDGRLDGEPAFDCDLDLVTLISKRRLPFHYEGGEKYIEVIPLATDAWYFP